MLSFVLRMASLRDRITSITTRVFPWVWRLAVLVLPWQTRWFQEGPQIVGYPWEEGRISIYASQLLMLAVVLAHAFLRRSNSESSIAHKKQRRLLLLLIAVFFFISLSTTASLRATAEWWIEVSILVLFVRVLIQRVTWKELSFWFVLSLLPQALLGITQAFTQRVFGTSLLGIATQDPAIRGVAVIESNGIRWLRSYGGFPHPNILGGWLVMGIICSFVALKERYSLKKERIIYYTSLVLFSIALALTYSRSAWLAFGVFVGLTLLSLLFSKRDTQKGFSMVLLVISLVSCALPIFLRPHLFFARGQTGARLEQKSLSERAQGIQNGWRILRAHPLTGSGLGANALVIARLDEKEGRVPSIPISPHVVPLLGISEAGIIGFMFFVYLLGFFFQVRRLRSSHLGGHWYFYLCFFVLVLSPILVLDHYFWSYWSGKALFFISCLFVISYQINKTNAAKNN